MQDEHFRLFYPRGEAGDCRSGDFLEQIDLLDGFWVIAKHTVQECLQQRILAHAMKGAFPRRR
jgi:hypothetical protein